MAGPSPVKTFKCTSCGAPISLRALDQALSVACVSCGSVLDATNEQYKILCQYKKIPKFDPCLELGSMGTLMGTKWMIVGYMIRSDETNVYFWDEYLLYNPQKGFRWLVEYQGHWSFVVTVKGKPEINFSGGASYYNRNYKLFLKGQARVHYVVGEFYWKIEKAEISDVSDYICPPEMLSLEKSQGDVVWSLGQYVEREKIEAAFAPKKVLPVQVGVAPHQPSPHAATESTIFQYFCCFITFLLAFNILMIIWSANKVVYNSLHTATTEAITTESFEIPGKIDNVEFYLESAVSNSWMSVEIDLINESTGQAYELENGVEYYSGSDYDGFWSEGSQKNSEIISSIPGGRYHLVLKPQYSSGSGYGLWGSSLNVNKPDYRLIVRRGVAIWSNFWWITGTLSVLLLFVVLARWQFEVSRWSTSDFSPYNAE